MARRRKKRVGKVAKARSRRKTKRAPHGLQEAIQAWFPAQFFSRWRVTRGSKWSPQRVFWMAMLMVWGTEQSLQARFDEARQVLKSLCPKWPLGTSYTGWYEAQQSWSTCLQPALNQKLRRQIQSLSDRHWLRQGWAAFAVDGSRVECPRTKANERELKCAGRTKTAPQLFVTTLLHMGTGLPWDFRIGPGTASERRHLEDMLACLPSRALLVADAGFTGYDLFTRILAAKRNFLVRVGANVHLLRELGYYEREGPNTVYLWPDKNHSRPPIVLRLIERRQGKKKMYLVTNVLDKKALSEKNAGVLYEMRWGVEVFYRSFKQTLAKRKMLSHSPKAAKAELAWALYGTWLLQCLTVSRIIARNGDPLRWSAAQARDRVRASMRSALAGRKDRELKRDLGHATIDDYARHSSKKARDWPHKKNDPPPGNPKIRLASRKERKAAKRLASKRIAA